MCWAAVTKVVGAGTTVYSTDALRGDRERHERLSDP